MNGTLIFLENEAQAKEYLKKIRNIPNVLPITFDFKAEKLLSDNKIIFRMDDDYERDYIYRGIHKKAKKIIENILLNFNISYGGVELFSLFYSRLYFRITNLEKYFRILNEIIKKEEPKKIYVFENKKDSLFCNVVENIFDGELIKINYDEEKIKQKRERVVFKLVGILQKIYAISNLFLPMKKGRRIFMSGGKTYFSSIARELSKNNKIINFDDCLRKSFFIRGIYLPFYEFSGRSDPENQKLLKKNIDLWLEQMNSEDLKGILDLDKETSNVIKQILFY